MTPYQREQFYAHIASAIALFSLWGILFVFGYDVSIFIFHAVGLGNIRVGFGLTLDDAMLLFSVFHSLMVVLVLRFRFGLFKLST